MTRLSEIEARAVKWRTSMYHGSSVDSSAGADREWLLGRLREAQEALQAILNELGVPGVGYPAPAANAVKIALEALAALEKP